MSEYTFSELLEDYLECRESYRDECKSEYRSKYMMEHLKESMEHHCKLLDEFMDKLKKDN